MAQLEEPFDEEKTKQKLYELGLSAVDTFTASGLIKHFQKKLNRPVLFTNYGFDSADDFLRSIPFVVEIASTRGTRFKCIRRPKPSIAPTSAPTLQPTRESAPPEETSSAVDPPSEPLLQPKVEPENEPGETPATTTVVGENKESEVADTIETEDASSVDVVELPSNEEEEETEDSEEDTDGEDEETEEVKRDQEETNKLGEKRQRLHQVDARVQEVAVKPTKSVSFKEISTVYQYSTENPLTQRIPIVVDELSADESDDKEKSDKPDLADEYEPDKVDSGEKDEESHADRASGEECSHPSFFVEEKEAEKKTSGGGLLNLRTTVFVDELSSDDDEELRFKMDVGKEGSMTKERPFEITSPEEVAEPALAREKEVEKVGSGKKPLENQKEGVDEYASWEPTVAEEKNAEEVASGAKVAAMQMDRAVEDSSVEDQSVVESSDEVSQPAVVEEQEKTNSSRPDDLPRDAVEERSLEASVEPENEAIKVSMIDEAVPVAVGKGQKEGSQQAEMDAGQTSGEQTNMSTADLIEAIQKTINDIRSMPPEASIARAIAVDKLKGLKKLLDAKDTAPRPPLQFTPSPPSIDANKTREGAEQTEKDKRRQKEVKEAKKRLALLHPNATIAREMELAIINGSSPHNEEKKDASVTPPSCLRLPFVPTPPPIKNSPLASTRSTRPRIRASNFADTSNTSSRSCPPKCRATASCSKDSAPEIVTIEDDTPTPRRSVRGRTVTGQSTASKKNGGAETLVITLNSDGEEEGIGESRKEKAQVPYGPKILKDDDVKPEVDKLTDVVEDASGAKKPELVLRLYPKLPASTVYSGPKDLYNVKLPALPLPTASVQEEKPTIIDRLPGLMDASGIKHKDAVKERPQDAKMSSTSSLYAGLQLPKTTSPIAVKENAIICADKTPGGSVVTGKKDLDRVDPPLPLSAQEVSPVVTVDNSGVKDEKDVAKVLGVSPTPIHLSVVSEKEKEVVTGGFKLPHPVEKTSVVPSSSQQKLQTEAMGSPMVITKKTPQSDVAEKIVDAGSSSGTKTPGDTVVTGERDQVDPPLPAQKESPVVAVENSGVKERKNTAKVLVVSPTPTHLSAVSEKEKEVVEKTSVVPPSNQKFQATESPIAKKPEEAKMTSTSSLYAGLPLLKTTSPIAVKENAIICADKTPGSSVVTGEKDQVEPPLPLPAQKETPAVAVDNSGVKEKKDVAKVHVVSPTPSHLSVVSEKEKEVITGGFKLPDRVEKTSVVPPSKQKKLQTEVMESSPTVITKKTPQSDVPEKIIHAGSSSGTEEEDAFERVIPPEVVEKEGPKETLSPVVARRDVVTTGSKDHEQVEDPPVPEPSAQKEVQSIVAIGEEDTEADKATVIVSPVGGESVVVVEQSESQDEDHQKTIGIQEGDSGAKKMEVTKTVTVAAMEGGEEGSEKNDSATVVEEAAEETATNPSEKTSPEVATPHLAATEVLTEKETSISLPFVVAEDVKEKELTPSDATKFSLLNPAAQEPIVEQDSDSQSSRKTIGAMESPVAQENESAERTSEGNSTPINVIEELQEEPLKQKTVTAVPVEEGTVEKASDPVVATKVTVVPSAADGREVVVSEQTTPQPKRRRFWIPKRRSFRSDEASGMKGEDAVERGISPQVIQKDSEETVSTLSEATVNVPVASGEKVVVVEQETPLSEVREKSVGGMEEEDVVERGIASDVVEKEAPENSTEDGVSSTTTTSSYDLHAEPLKQKIIPLPFVEEGPKETETEPGSTVEKENSAASKKTPEPGNSDRGEKDRSVVENENVLEKEPEAPVISEPQMATEHQDPDKVSAEENPTVDRRRNEVESPPPIVITPPISSSSSARPIFTDEVHLEARASTPGPEITGLPMTSASVAVPEQVAAEIVEAERLRQILKDVGGLLAVDELVTRSEVSRERVEELAATTDKFFIGLDEDGGKEYATIVGEQLSHVIEWLCGLLEFRGAPMKFTTLKREYAKKYEAALKHDERKDLVGFSGEVAVFCHVLTKTGKLIHYGEGPAKRHFLALPGMHVVETPEAGGEKEITREVTPETPEEVTKKGKKKEAGGSGRKRTRNNEGEEGETGGAKKRRRHHRRSSDAEELGDQDSEEDVKEEIVSPKAKKSLKRRHDSDEEDDATDKAYGLVVSLFEMAEKSGADLHRLAKKFARVVSEELLRD